MGGPAAMVSRGVSSWTSAAVRTMRAAITREAFGYYDVFESPLYGEVVLRKKERFPWWQVWVFAGVGVGLFLWRRAGRGTLKRALS